MRRHSDQVAAALGRVGDDLIGRLPEANRRHGLEAGGLDPRTQLIQIAVQFGGNALQLHVMVDQVVTVDIDGVQVDHCQALILQQRRDGEQVDLALAGQRHMLGVVQCLFGEG